MYFFVVHFSNGTQGRHPFKTMAAAQDCAQTLRDFEYLDNPNVVYYTIEDDFGVERDYIRTAQEVECTKTKLETGG